MRKGYGAEYYVKRKLEAAYGKDNIKKMPFWSFLGDFIVIEPSGPRVLQIVEVKSSKGKWYPDKRDREQFESISAFSHQHSIPVEYWVRERGKWSVESLEQVRKRFGGLKRLESRLKEATSSEKVSGEDNRASRQCSIQTQGKAGKKVRGSETWLKSLIIL